MPDSGLSFHEDLTKVGLTRAKGEELVLQQNFAWWSRLWVIQEVVFCNTLQVCIGSHVLPWYLFTKMCTRMFSNMVNVPPNTGLPRDIVLAAIERLETLIKLRNDLRNDVRGQNIVTLLRNTSPRGVSYPGDRVYSLLSLATENDRKHIPIKYGDDIVEVYKDVIDHVIRTRESINILFEGWPRGLGRASADAQPIDFPNILQDEQLLSRLEDQAEDQISWPSWLPNFSCPWEYNSFDPRGYSKYLPSRATRPRVNFSGTSMLLDAVFVDEICKTQSAPSPTRHCTFKTQPYCPHCVKHMQAQLFAKDEALTDAASVFESSRLALRSQAISMTLKLAKDRSRKGTLEDAMFFSTTLGFIGFEPLQAQAGDEIIFPFGSQLPLIVRPLEALDGVGSDQSVHSLICQCYVHGLTESNLMTRADCGEIETKTYKLR